MQERKEPLIQRAQQTTVESPVRTGAFNVRVPGNTTGGIFESILGSSTPPVPSGLR